VFCIIHTININCYLQSHNLSFLVMMMQSVFDEVGSEFVYSTYINFIYARKESVLLKINSYPANVENRVSS